MDSYHLPTATGSKLAAIRRRMFETFFRLTASGLLPRTIFAKSLPAAKAPRKCEPLQLEIVSHCWQYSWLLMFQLSSLVLHRWTNVHVTMTVCYSPEDEPTAQTLAFFEKQKVPNLRWNWLPFSKENLFRRAIGRNKAALATEADWVWFTDCDQVFHRGCIEALAVILMQREELLLFPRIVGCTPPLSFNDSFFQKVGKNPSILDSEPSEYQPQTRRRAIGALQILRGDAARAMGYCRDIKFYQEPRERWLKGYEDRTFRWLVGTQGTAIDVSGIYRIEHSTKGRKGHAPPAARGL